MPISVWRRRGNAAGLCALALALALAAGCGSSGSGGGGTSGKPRRAAQAAHRRAQPDPICSAGARAVLAAALRVPATAIATKRSIGSNASPQCTFTVHRRHGRSLVVLANVDSGPQPYAVLERQEVEMSQIFGPQRLVAAPTPVSRLGIEAWWFPSLKQVIATDGKRLITTSVLRPRMAMRRQRALDIVLNRPYLTAHVNPNGPLARTEDGGSGVSGPVPTSSSTTTGG